MAEQWALPHKITLEQREKLTVSGVTEVVRFDENAVILKTQMGTLIIQGAGLQLKTLSVEGGQVAVDGKIGAMVYEEPRADGFFRRLFQ